MSEAVNLDLLGWDDVASTRPVVPDGEYTLKIVEPVIKAGKKGPYFNADLIVQAGPHAGFRIFRGLLFSFKPDQIWRFKGAAKALRFTPSASGLPFAKVAEEFRRYVDGLDIVARVNSKTRQVWDGGQGDYVPDPEGGKENQVQSIVGRA